jgi:hypothetical protein
MIASVIISPIMNALTAIDRPPGENFSQGTPMITGICGVAYRERTSS